MKNNHQVEVIIFSNYSLRNLHQEELVKWIGTTAQSVIHRQQERTKKIFLKNLTGVSPIYMS